MPRLYVPPDVILLMFIVAAGHYMSLVNSDRRAGMSAALTTPFITTNGMCLEMWVKFLGTSNASIEVQLYREDFAQLKPTTVISSRITIFIGIINIYDHHAGCSYSYC